MVIRLLILCTFFGLTFAKVDKDHRDIRTELAMGLKETKRTIRKFEKMEMTSAQRKTWNSLVRRSEKLEKLDRELVKDKEKIVKKSDLKTYRFEMKELLRKLKTLEKEFNQYGESEKCRLIIEKLEEYRLALESQRKDVDDYVDGSTIDYNARVDIFNTTRDKYQSNLDKLADKRCHSSRVYQPINAIARRP